jgi:hypothetical protein
MSHAARVPVSHSGGSFPALRPQLSGPRDEIGDMIARGPRMSRSGRLVIGAGRRFRGNCARQDLGEEDAM